MTRDKQEEGGVINGASRRTRCTARDVHTIMKATLWNEITGNSREARYSVRELHDDMPLANCQHNGDSCNETLVITRQDYVGLGKQNQYTCQNWMEE